MNIEFLPAYHGDCILIRFADKDGMKRNILIDGGPRQTYRQGDRRKRNDGPRPLHGKLEQIKNDHQKIDLLIVTHVDDDHIAGILEWMEAEPAARDMLCEVWFNSGRRIFAYCNNPAYYEENDNCYLLHPERSTLTSIPQGVALDKYLEKHYLGKQQVIKAGGDPIRKFGLTFTILSPNKKNLEALLHKWEKEVGDTRTSAKKADYKSSSLKALLKTDTGKFVEDRAVHNGSAIAFILTDGPRHYLFLADAHPGTLIESLRRLGYSKDHPLQAVLVKVSHHGSKGNTSPELLELIESRQFVISTDGSKHGLPDKACLARIIHRFSEATLYFNYPDLIGQIFTDQDYRDFSRFRTMGADKISL